MPVVIAMAASARVEMLAARDVFIMSSPRAAPTRVAVAAMFGSDPCTAANIATRVRASLRRLTPCCADSPPDAESLAQMSSLSSRCKAIANVEVVRGSIPTERL